MYLAVSTILTGQMGVLRYMPLIGDHTPKPLALRASQGQGTRQVKALDSLHRKHNTLFRTLSAELLTTFTVAYVIAASVSLY